jgi:hypothetical protein
MPTIRPLENPSTAQWGLAITHSDYEKMVKGWKPTSMDDKWMVVTDAPDAQGNTVVHICRSWLGHEIYSFTVEAGDPNHTEAKDWGKIVEISWKDPFAGLPVMEEEAKDTAINYCKGMLRCELKDYVYLSVDSSGEE